MTKNLVKVMSFDGIPYRYRPGTTDEKVAREVITNRCYRRASAGFDVEPGEHWLDLGANVGAFAVYCKIRGATAECYEPDADCFDLLVRNAVGFRCVRAAVTGRTSTTVGMWTSAVPGNHYRGTVLGSLGRSVDDPIEVPNVFAGDLVGWYDGVKMDIEGGEFDLIDRWLIPPCHKLCLEYHTSRDQSMTNLGRRLDVLRSKFVTVSYVPELDRLLAAGGMRKSFHDRVIYCTYEKPRGVVPAG